jgi:diacylglycerol kinase family enzyme
MLDLYSIDIRGPWDALGVVSAVARKQFSQAQNVSRVQAAAFRITSRRPHHVFADGEHAGKTPVEITVVPRALDVLVPQ